MQDHAIPALHTKRGILSRDTQAPKADYAIDSVMYEKGTDKPLTIEKNNGNGTYQVKSDTGTVTTIGSGILVANKDS